MREDTIAAISTPQGTGGISIVRMSGENAFHIADLIFKGKIPFSQMDTHTIKYGKIIDPQNQQVLDEVMITKLQKPHTFTREDVVEINCHGSSVVIRKILELVIRLGARPAEPGEFTKRAFLLGRIDLSQAEAVIDLIHAKTEESSRAALHQLEGRLSVKLKAVRQQLVDLLAHIEVTVDYPEHDIEEITGEKVYAALKNIIKDLKSVTRSFEKGRIIREGVQTVIAGRPNAGKSSLLNALTGKNKAIVTDIPGTTRDIIEEYISIRGIPLKIVDTAGLRETEDVVEKIGVEKTKAAMETSDLILYLIDASQPISEEDVTLIQSLEHKKKVVVVNKIDIAEPAAIQRLMEKLQGQAVIEVSVKNEIGLDMLEETIYEMFVQGDIEANNEVLVTNVRHKVLIDQAAENILEACQAYESGMPLDCIAIDIKNSVENLGQITGESVSEDVMHAIFSRFCIGK